MGNFHMEHIQTDPYQKQKPMTTALAIKCIDGIVLASDSQGTQNGILKKL